MKRRVCALMAAGLLLCAAGCGAKHPPEETAKAGESPALFDSPPPPAAPEPEPWDEAAYFETFVQDMKTLFFEAFLDMGLQFMDTVERVSDGDDTAARSIIEGRYFNMADKILRDLRTYRAAMPEEAEAEAALAENAAAIADTAALSLYDFIHQLSNDRVKEAEAALSTFADVYKKDLPAIETAFEERAAALGIALESLYIEGTLSGMWQE